MKITVLGCGRWGSFHLWYAAKQGYQVTGWEPADSENFALLVKNRSNPYLTLPDSVKLTTSIEQALEADQIIISVPAQLFRGLASQLAEYDLSGTDIVLCMKGLELSTGKRLSVVAEEEGLHCRSVSIWVGPGHPQDFVAGVPGCMLVSSLDEEASIRITERMGSPLVRMYRSTDLIGCEIGAAAKNVVGIAAGMLDGMKMSGLKGALMARAPQEVARLVQASGGDWRSVYGLSHLGDYEATLFSKFSRNRNFGESLVREEEMSGLAEGVPTSHAMLSLAEKLSVELPITSMVRSIIDEETDLKTAIGQLFLRPQKEEFSASLK
ncbi:MAG: glycerol-3-phosphate dehydrogenase [Candidatus Sabulitectum sp.]|nr:glycerol-3-phosphate dehydrogenase [Candidatus Sabulitectum sp.]